MNNWRLLLLAVVVVVQPIGSFTESNLFDGRECCERRSTQDERLYRHSKTEERRHSLDGIRDEQRPQPYPGPMVTRSERKYFQLKEKRISPVNEATFYKRFARDPERQHRSTPELRENRNEFRSSIGQNERNSGEARNRNTLGATRSFRISKDNARDGRIFERESRLSIRASQNTENRRVSAITEEMGNHKREGVVRSDNGPDRINAHVRSERIQLDDNRNLRGNNYRTRRDTQNRFSRFSEGQNNGVRAVQAERSVERSEKDNHNFRDASVRSDIRQQRRTEDRDRVRRESERVSDVSDERRRDVSQRLDTLRHRNYEERRLDSRSRSFDMARTNDERMDERRHLSLDRMSMTHLSRVADRNKRDETLVRNLGTKISDVRRHQRETDRLTSDRTVSSLRDVQDINENRQESRKFDNRGDIYSGIYRDLSNKERDDLRRLALERSMELRQKTSAERRQINRSTRISRLTNIEASGMRDDTRSNERLDERRHTRDLKMTSTREVRTPGIATGLRNRDQVDENRVMLGSDVRMTVDDTNRMHVERRQDNSGTISDSRVRETREQEVRMYQRLDSRRQRVDYRSNKMVLAERHGHREAIRDLQIQDETRNLRTDQNVDLRRQREALSRSRERLLTGRSQENRDISHSRNLILATRNPETRMGLESRNTDRLIEKTRMFKRDSRFVERSLEATDVRRESKSDIRSNYNKLAMERMEHTMRLKARQNDDSRTSITSLNFRDTFQKSEESTLSWTMIFYTLQGIYLCGLLVQILTEKPENGSKTKKRSIWWTYSKNLVKLD